jgi:UDP-N-acetylmuramate dehydrogenase
LIPLINHSTFALNAYAKQLITINTVDQLEQIDWSEPFYILGEGSNTVFIDDFAGTIVCIANQGVTISETTDDYYVEVAAGENWHKLVCICLEKGINGLENLALIPGTVGAAPVQNIGAYGVEVNDLISQVDGYNITTGQYESLMSQACQFAYRDSIFKHDLKNRFVITSVTFKLSKHWVPNLSYGPLSQLEKPTAKEVFNEVVAIRMSKLPDPKIEPNAGSFFKNPIVAEKIAHDLREKYPTMPSYPATKDSVKLAAGWLIEQAGLKGYQVGGIHISSKQALVLINNENGTNSELLALIKLIQEKVYSLFKVKLEHEVRLIGALGELTIGVD